jgi:hypothetical protein
MSCDHRADLVHEQQPRLAGVLGVFGVDVVEEAQQQLAAVDERPLPDPARGERVAARRPSWKTNSSISTYGRRALQLLGVYSRSFSGGSNSTRWIRSRASATVDDAAQVRNAAQLLSRIRAFSSGREMGPVAH